jgi:hypothetical protein
VKLVAENQETPAALRDQASKWTNNAKDLSETLQVVLQNRIEAEAAEALRSAQKRWIQKEPTGIASHANMDSVWKILKALVHAALETYQGTATYIVEEKDGTPTLTQLSPVSSPVGAK